MAEEFQYQKERQKFGRHPNFEDTETRIVGSINYNETQKDLYQLRDPNKISLTNVPLMSEHRVSQAFLNLSNFKLSG